MRIRGRKQKKELSAAIHQGHRLLAAQHQQEAFEFLGEAVLQFPDDPEIRLLYASILLAFRPDGVPVEAAKAVELGPDNPVILVRAAHLMLGKGEVKTARSYAARAHKLVEPDFLYMPGLVNLDGRLAAHDGRDDIAEEKFRIAVESDPAFSSFAVDLAQFLASLGRQAEAVAVLDEALAHIEKKDDLERMRARIASEICA